MKNTEKLLSDREERLLNALIREYIDQAQPVGSKKLVQTASLNLSSASIRNVMADLEELGLIASPHTSAGRVPTVQGYRYFVDSLLNIKPLQPVAVEKMIKEFAGDYDTTSIIANASAMLSKLTSLAGIVTLPRRQRVQLAQIEFLPLSDNRVLSILVTDDNEVQNRIIPVKRVFESGELRQAANYLNTMFAGKEIRQVRNELLNELNEARQSMDQKMQAVVEMANKMFADENQDDQSDFVVAGETNLMDQSEFASVDTLKQVFEAFNKKRDILELLDQCLSADGMQIFIGDESGYQGLGDCSLVTSTYSVDGQVIGTLGVIGPTRMPYEQVISVVDITAKLVSSALKSK